MDEIKNLFRNLAKRINNENELSDVTLAFCETYPEFKKKFLTFFFSNKINPKEALIRREVTSDDSRPDFIIETYNSGKYLIEVKIMDSNHHFKKYYDEFSKQKGFENIEKQCNENCRFGYIANYIISDSSLGNDDREHKVYYNVKTWEEFYVYLEKDQIVGDNVKSIYLEYLKNVCGIIKYRKMNLSNLTSLYYLNNAIKKTIKEVSFNNWTVSDNEIKARSGEGSQGYSFYFRNSKDNKLMYMDFSVYFYPNEKNENNITIDLSIEKASGANSVVYPKLLSKTEEFGKFYDKVFVDEDIIYFELINEKFKAFELPEKENITVKDQLDILKEFYKEVMQKIVSVY